MTKGLARAVKERYHDIMCKEAMMVRHDIDLARRAQTVAQAGFAEPARGTATAGSG